MPSDLPSRQPNWTVTGPMPGIHYDVTKDVSKGFARMADPAALPPELDLINLLDVRCSRCERRGGYVVAGECGNCGWKGHVMVSKTHKKPYDAKCPRCDCPNVRGGAFICELPPEVGPLAA